MVGVRGWEDRLKGYFLRLSLLLGHKLRARKVCLGTALGHLQDVSIQLFFVLFVFCCLFFFFFFFFGLFAISWGAPAAYGGSQARGPIGAVAASLRQSHSNAGSEPRLQPTPATATATPDP